MLQYFRGNQEAKTKHFLMKRHRRRSLSRETAFIDCATLLCNHVQHVVGSPSQCWSQGEDGKKALGFFLSKVLFSHNIKQHFVDNYCSLQLSLHKTQFGAAGFFSREFTWCFFVFHLLCMEQKTVVVCDGESSGEAGDEYLM